MAQPIGVLLMAYGGPNSLAEVEPYLLDVRGFRPTSPHVVEEVRARYAAIGGRSPILEGTQAQGRALEAALGNGNRFQVAVGMRHWQPRIGEALTRLAALGVTRAVGLVMAPHYSRMSIDLYLKLVEEKRGPVEVAPIREWHLLPGYIEALVDRVRAGLGQFSAEERPQVPILFTAHSLPRRILEWQDPYPDQLQATVAAVVDRLGAQPHRFAYQSAAMTPDPWLGPDAGTELDALVAAGSRNVLVAPVGFTCEHVEVLYDLDIELRRRAEGLGARLERIEMVGHHPAMMAGLADRVRGTAAEQGWL